MKLAAAVALLSSMATATLAAEGAGKAVAVTDLARATGDAGDRALAAGADVYVGDVVITDDTGQAQIRFADDTKMVVGKNSSLVIDEMLFRGKSAENRFAVRALGGAFRFISGDSGDKGYTIRTPTATIGVRGTAFELFVKPAQGNDPGYTKLLHREGEVTMCSTENEEDCETITAPCGAMQTDEERKVRTVGNGDDKATPEEFPFAGSDDDLEEDFRVAGTPCLAGGLSQQALGGSLPVAAGGAGAFLLIGAALLGGSDGGDADVITTTTTNP